MGIPRGAAMDDRAALLRAVCASPDDDLPRLAYADCLEDHADPARAEFIRVDVQLARAAGPLTAPELRPLTDRWFALRAAHEARWRDELPGVPAVRYGALLRGFPNSMTVDSPAAFPPDLLPLVFDELPIRYLTLAGPVPFAGFVALPLPWGQLKHGELYGPGWTDDEWLRLPDTPVAATEFIGWSPARGTAASRPGRSGSGSDAGSASGWASTLRADAGYSPAPASGANPRRIWFSVIVRGRTNWSR